MRRSNAGSLTTITPDNPQRNRKPSKVHWLRAKNMQPMCGGRYGRGITTDVLANVTCQRCKEILTSPYKEKPNA